MTSGETNRCSEAGFSLSGIGVPDILEACSSVTPPPPPPAEPVPHCPLTPQAD